jgi:WhiB family redox-sensing transcriptional regulator
MADIRRLPAPLAQTWDWQLQAACRDLDSAQFFHPEHERGMRKAKREEQAKAICHRCPVLQACREHALSAHEPYGVWGGMTEEERRLELRTRRTVAAA